MSPTVLARLKKLCIYLNLTWLPGLDGLEDIELLALVELQVPEPNLLGHPLSQLLAELRRDAMLAHELDRSYPRIVGAAGCRIQRRLTQTGRSIGRCTGAKGCERFGRSCGL